MALPENFVAGRGPGSGPPGWGLTVLPERDLGTLAVPTGRLAVMDPFAEPESPIVVDVPAGVHRISATPAVESMPKCIDGEPLPEPGPGDDLDEQGIPSIWAAVSLHLAEGEPAEVVRWSPRGEVPFVLDEDRRRELLADVGSLPVDSATVGLVDAEAATTIPLGDDGWWSRVYHGTGGYLRRSLELHGSEGLDGTYAVTAGRDGEELLVLSLQGDGDVPILLTRDAEGRLLGVHLDLLSLADIDPDELAEEAGPDAPVHAFGVPLALDPGYVSALPPALEAVERLPSIIDDQLATAMSHDLSDLLVRERDWMETTVAEWPAGHAVLDLGCGTGRVARLVADSGCRVTGVDVAPAMIREGRRRHPDLDLREGSALDLPLGDGSVDAIVSWGGLDQLSPEMLVIAAREMVRVLRPGGEAALALALTDDGHHVLDLALRWERWGSPDEGHAEVPVWQMSMMLLGRTLGAVGFSLPGGQLTHRDDRASGRRLLTRVHAV